MPEVKLPKLEPLKEDLVNFKRRWDIHYAMYLVFGEPEWLVKMLGGALPPNKPFKELTDEEFMYSFNCYLKYK